MKKVYWGFTKEQIWILSILSAGVLLGVGLKYVPSWNKNLVYENFKKDSILLAQKMEKYYSDSFYHNEEMVDKYVDSLKKTYGIKDKKKTSKESKKTVTINFPVNINTASLEELTAIKGIGIKTAEKIIDYRKKNGPFKTTASIQAVSGIGPKKYSKIQNSITVAGE